MPILTIGVVLAATVWSTPAGASSWAPAVAASTYHGESHGGASPSAPTGVSGTCVSSTTQTVTVAWSAVTRATKYSVYASTTSATGTYSAVATGITTTSWTSSSLSAGNYWFKVVAYTGTNWASGQSTATSQRTIASGSCG